MSQGQNRWHELPLGAFGVLNDPPIPSLIRLLAPMVRRAIVCFCHDYPEETVPEEVLKQEWLYFGYRIRHPRDWWRVELVYRLTSRPMLRRKKQRQGWKDPNRLRELHTWIGKGSHGGISLFLRKRASWKEGRFLMGQE